MNNNRLLLCDSETTIFNRFTICTHIHHNNIAQHKRLIFTFVTLQYQMHCSTSKKKKRNCKQNLRSGDHTFIYMLITILILVILWFSIMILKYLQKMDVWVHHSLIFSCEVHKLIIGESNQTAVQFLHLLTSYSAVGGKRGETTWIS